MINPLNLVIKPASVYRFAELLSRPYNQFDAYRKGLISESGKLVGRGGDLDGLEYIALRVKNIFNDLMPGQNKYLLSNLTGTLKLFNEEFQQMGMNREEINIIIEKYVFEVSDGSLSYLDYLLEEASHRYIAEDVGGMMSGGEGNIGNPTASTMEGGIAAYDLPFFKLQIRKPRKLKRKKRKGKRSYKIVEQVAEEPTDVTPVDPYLTLQVDPTEYEEITRANTPSGIFDPSQLTNPDSRRYFKRLVERNKKKQIYIVGNQQQPPTMLRLA